jgi:predicted PurR-regulated permease PerM
VADAPEATLVEVDVGPRALITLAASVALVAVALGFARSVPRSLAASAVAVLVALGLDPVVSGIERRLRLSRGAALGLVLAMLGVFVVGVGAVLLPSAATQVRQIDEDLPRSLRELGNLPIVGDDIAKADLPARLERVVDDLPQRLTGEDTPVVRIGLRAADGAVAVAVTLLLAITLALDGPWLVGLVERLVPARHRRRAARVADLGYRAVGRYVTGSLTVALVAGLFTLVVGLAFGVPLAPLLALWVMVWDLVPQIGGAAGGIPLVVLALTQGAVTGLAVGALFVVYLQLENNVLGPLLVGGAIKLSPPATMTAALIGVSAGGVVGALLAVPLVGAAKAVYLELRPAAAAAAPVATARRRAGRRRRRRP